MAIKDVLALLDAEIATLREARQLLKADSTGNAVPRKAGRPRKAENAFADSSNDNCENEEEAEPVAGRTRPDCGGGQAALGSAEKGREVAVRSPSGRNRSLWEQRL
jgi:hypothetical protein